MKNHCRILFATVLLLLILVSCKEEALNLTSEAPAWQAQTRAAIEGLNANSMKVLSSTESSLVLELDVNSYAKNAVSIDGKEYFAISAPEAHRMLKEGNPDLPEYAYSVVIPPTSACNVRVVDAEYEDISLTVAPSKGGISSRVDPSTVPYTFSEAYEKDAFYPAKLASTDAPFLMRDVRGSVLRLHPFQYNPVTGTLRVYNKMKVEVSFSGTDSRNVLTSSVRHSNKSFDNILKHQFLNYDVMAAASVKNIQPKNAGGDRGLKSPPPSEDMLIICCDSFATDMSSFIIHKNDTMNITTRLVTMSQVVTSAENIAKYILKDYNVNGNLAYVLLVGDAERVPTMLCEDEIIMDEGGADPIYSLVSGEDSIPDIIVGRFSARTRSEVQTMVARTIRYENQSVQPWQHRSVGIAGGNRLTIYNTNIPLSPFDFQYMDSIRNMLLYSTYGTGGVERLYDSAIDGSITNNDPDSFAICNAINSGAFVVNYLGFSDSRHWFTGDFYKNRVDSLQNDNKLPFVYSNGEGVGDFTGDFDDVPPPCFAEKWLTARNSSTGAATGAIGFFGSSVDPQCQWLESKTASIAFNNLLVSNDPADVISFGALCYGSTINMVTEHGNSTNYILLTWNYFGDPSLVVIPNYYIAE